jgi:hypothetical protein
MQNGKVGRVTFFFSRKRLYCLSCIKIPIKNYNDYIMESTTSRMKVQQHVLDRSYYSLQHHWRKQSQVQR